MAVGYRVNYAITTMQRRLWITLACSLCLTLTACGGNTADGGAGPSGGAAPGGGSGKIYLGVATPLSGAQSVFGEDQLNAAKLAVQEANAKGGIKGRQVEIVEGDDQADPKQAAIVAQKLVSTDGVLGVIGHFNSGSSIPASATYNRADLTMISPGSTNPKLTDQGFKNVFRVVGRDDQQGEIIGKYAVDTLKAKVIVVLHDKTAYGQGLAEFFRKTVEAGGAKVVYFEGITQGDKDFRAVLTKVKGLNPDALFFGGVFTESGLIASQARQVGITASFLSGDGSKEESFIKTLGADTSKVYISSVAQVNSKDFGASYQKTYQRAPGPYAPYAYDAARILLASIAKAPGDALPDRKTVMENVAATKDFPGLGGPINFDSKGDPVKAPFQVFVIKNGAFVPTS
jgi:branched-chain amino acid transport system substrate-binding protein